MLDHTKFQFQGNQKKSLNFNIYSILVFNLSSVLEYSIFPLNVALKCVLVS